MRLFIDVPAPIVAHVRSSIDISTLHASCTTFMSLEDNIRLWQGGELTVFKSS